MGTLKDALNMANPNEMPSALQRLHFGDLVRDRNSARR